MADDIKINNQGKETFASAGTESFNLASDINEQASEVKLTIDEDSEGVVLEKGVEVDKKKSGIKNLYSNLNKLLLSKSKVKIKEKATFFQLLGVMVNAGIPMIRALKALYSQMDKSPRMQMIIEAMSLKIEDGASLSVAMTDYPDVFSESEVGMVESGEESGQITRVLDNLATDADKAYTIKKKVKSAMMYPVIVLSLLVLVVIAMMIFVIPKLTDLFDSFGGELPFITKVVVGTSNFFINYGVNIAFAAMGLFVLFLFFRRTYAGKYMIDSFKLRIPIFGSLLQKFYLARFARSLNNLLDSDVSIVRTLEITANSVGSEVYKKRLLLAVEDIKQGIPLAENLTESRLFPPMLINMIDVGEKTAQLDEITGKVAMFYEDEVDTSVAGFSKIIEPIILAVVGLGVGTVVAAIMIPVMQLSNLSGVV